MNKDFQHALVLLEQQRYDLAEGKLRQSLAADPDDALTHALLARCLCERDELEEATSEARLAVHLDPELPEGYASLAEALTRRNGFRPAEEAAREALRLAPENADYHGQLAGIALMQRDWRAALAAAEEGLQHDPEHMACNNLRAMALVKLGRNAEAGQTIASTLARQPENAFSHANEGWRYLHEGRRQNALEHFREALRLDPTLDFARAGIVEALKSKNWLYAVVLRYFLWMARLSGTVQWAIILGGYFGYQALVRLVDEHPALAPWFRPVLVVYVVFALLTWLASPLFNLLLRLDGFGRHALSRDQIRASNWVGGLLAIALVFGAVWLVTDDPRALVGLGYFGLLLLPVSAIFNCDSGWPRGSMILYTAALAVIGLAWLPLSMAGRGDFARLSVQAFVWGSVLSSLVANVLIMQTPRR
jgi:cytochrome c-type biogenesis protein CcmH/NrfG